MELQFHSELLQDIREIKGFEIQINYLSILYQNCQFLIFQSQSKNASAGDSLQITQEQPKKHLIIKV